MYSRKNNFVMETETLLSWQYYAFNILQKREKKEKVMKVRDKNYVYVSS